MHIGCSLEEFFVQLQYYTIYSLGTILNRILPSARLVARVALEVC